jgi:subfamily B ATP-binding cassette protein HlyB/CyaB
MTSSPHHPQQNLDTGLVCLLILARYFGVPADADQLEHQFGETGKTLAQPDLLRAAKHLGFKAGVVDSDWSRLSVIQLPAIARTAKTGTGSLSEDRKPDSPH